MRIALVRGPSLNCWEMQNFQSLSRKHEVVAIASTEPIYDISSIKLPLIKLFCLGQILSFIPGSVEFLNRVLGDTSFLSGLEKTIIGFDIVHTAECANFYSLQAVRARKRGLVGKVIITCWENIPFNREQYPAGKKLKSEVREGADFFLAVTNQAKAALMAEGVTQKKIKVMPMGVDLEKFKVKSQKSKVKNILFVGRLEEEKGIWELLEAFKNLRKKFKNLELTIVGDGEQRKKIEKFIKKNLPNQTISLKNNLPYEQMPGVYREADIFVLPSKPTPVWKEQFGMVLVEAMACGLPIVAANSGAIPEVVGNAGLLVEAGNPSQLNQALEKLIKDAKLRKVLASKGRWRAEKYFNCLKIAAKIEAVYQKLLKT